MLDKSSHGDSIWERYGAPRRTDDSPGAISVACKVAPSGRDGLGD